MYGKGKSNDCAKELTGSNESNERAEDRDRNKTCHTPVERGCRRVEKKEFANAGVRTASRQKEDSPFVKAGRESKRLQKKGVERNYYPSRGKKKNKWGGQKPSCGRPSKKEKM